MLEYRSPKRIYVTLVSAGVVLGMTLIQLGYVLAGMVKFSDTQIVFPALLSIWLLPFGWRMVASLPWSMINDPAHFEYRNPYGPSKTEGDGGAKDAGSIPSRSSAPEDPER